MFWRLNISIPLYFDISIFPGFWSSDINIPINVSLYTWIPPHLCLCIHTTTYWCIKLCLNTCMLTSLSPHLSMQYLHLQRHVDISILPVFSRCSLPVDRCIYTSFSLLLCPHIHFPTSVSVPVHLFLYVSVPVSCCVIKGNPSTFVSLVHTVSVRICISIYTYRNGSHLPRRLPLIHPVVLEVFTKMFLRWRVSPLEILKKWNSRHGSLVALCLGSRCSEHLSAHRALVSM